MSERDRDRAAEQAGPKEYVLSGSQLICLAPLSSAELPVAAAGINIILLQSCPTENEAQRERERERDVCRKPKRASAIDNATSESRGRERAS